MAFDAKAFFAKGFDVRELLSASFGTDVTLQIFSQGAARYFQVVNLDPTKSAEFDFMDAQNNVIWSYTQPPNSSGSVTDVPVVDNNSQPISYQIGQQTPHGQTITTLTNPPWRFLSI